MRIGGIRNHLLPPAGRRYWEDRAKLTLKAVVAAVTAWLVAKYAVGHEQPYFAPLAALLGVYPTVVRSVRESLAYAGGFVLGAGLAIPVGLLLGPTTEGIAVVLVLAMMVSGWRRLGGQSSQVAFTALFALLLGGHDVVQYVLPRIGDVCIGLAAGLGVNAAIFPPLYLRRAEYAVGRVRDVLADALRVLAEEVIEPAERSGRWDERESLLADVQEQARYAVEQGEDSMRANPRVRLWGYPLRLRNVSAEWPAPRHLNTLDHAAAYARSIAWTLHQISAGLLSAHEEAEQLRPSVAFRHHYAALLRLEADLIAQLPGALDDDMLAEAARRQREMEEPHRGPGTDAPGLFDPRKELIRLSGLLLDAVRARQE